MWPGIVTNMCISEITLEVPNEHFNAYEDKDGLIVSDRKSQLPTDILAWSSPGYQLELSNVGTHFLFVQSDSSEVTIEIPGIGTTSYTLHKNMYMSVPGAAIVSGGKGIAVTRVGYRGLFSLGGPIERYGRLRYIDGGSDTLLISPPRMGDPCLNLLHFPPGTAQTRHTHQSNSLRYNCARAWSLCYSR